MTSALTVRRIPTWATPHRFATVPERSGERPRDLLTYGPIAEDALRIAQSLVGKTTALKALVIANRCIGLEWLTSIEQHSDNPAPRPASALRDFLTESYGLKPGFLHLPWNFYDERGNDSPPVLADRILNEFAAGPGAFAAQTLRRVKQYVDELGKAANERRAMKAMDPSSLLEEIAAADFADGPQVFRNISGEMVGVGLAVHRLDQRVFLEILDLLLDKTVIARCPACKRIFVPSRREPTHCRRYFWDALTYDLVRGCVSDAKAREIVGNLDTAAYRTEYLRRSKEIQRLEERLGRNHAEVVRRRSERDEWREKVGPKRRGRPVMPLPAQPSSTVQQSPTQGGNHG